MCAWIGLGQWWVLAESAGLFGLFAVWLAKFMSKL
jgi:hypothetical protein